MSIGQDRKVTSLLLLKSDMVMSVNRGYVSPLVLIILNSALVPSVEGA